MEDVKWIFDGIGTALISAFIGVLVGGTIGYKIGLKNHSKQSQKARDNVTQTQIGNVNVIDGKRGGKDE